MSVFTHTYRVDLDKPMQMRQSTALLLTGDAGSDRIRAEVFSGGQPYTLTGQATGQVILPNGQTQPITGHIEAPNIAYMDLPAEAYEIPGMVKITLRHVDGGVVNALVHLTATVSVGVTPTVIDEHDIINLSEIATAADNAEYWAGEAEEAATHAVQYDAAQTLTDTQKTQARTNIGAADAATVGLISSAVDTLGLNLQTAAQNALDAMTAAQGANTRITKVENAVDAITPWSIAEKFDGTYANLYRDSAGKVATNNNAKSAVIEIKDGCTYTIKATGTFNRFAVYVGNSTTTGSTITQEHFESGSFTSKEYEYTNSDDYAYMIVLVAFAQSGFACNLSIKEVTGTVGDQFSVKGVPVVMQSQFEEGLADTVEAVEDEIHDITGGIYEKALTATITDYALSGGAISSSYTGKLAYVPMKNGFTYKVHVTGTYNKFIVATASAVTPGTAYTSVHSESINHGTHDLSCEYENTNAAYLIIYYNLDSAGTASATVSVIETNAGDDVDFRVNGIQVYTAEQTLDTVSGEIHDITGGVYEKALTPTVTNYVVNQSAISSTYTGKLAYAEMKNGLTYKVNVSGTFNRFIIYTAAAVSVGSSCTSVYSQTISYGEHDISYEYTNTGNAKYLVIFYNYDGDGGAADATLTVAETNFDGDLALNGIGIYTAEQVDSLIGGIDLSPYLHYVSPQSVPLAADASAVYALYDALVTAYPDYVTKTTLGTDSGDGTIYGYQFGSGSYNSAGQRGRDTSKAKPTILLVAGVHGYERAAVMSLYQFLSDLCAGNSYLAELQNNYIFKAIPMVCPYAFTANTRLNANSVNINRNFDANWQSGGAGTQDYSGESAADQPETQVVQGWIDNNTGAVLYVDFHNSGYEDEVSYVAGANTAEGMTALKDRYLVKGYSLIPYFTKAEEFADDLIYAYTGDFSTTGMSYQYAQKKGILAVTLETSWEQGGSARHSAVTNRAGAIVLGNLLNAFIGK